MLANEKRLHLVELRNENDNFPRLVASPENVAVRTKDEIGHDEILDFEIISYDGHMPYFRPEKQPFFERLPAFQVNDGYSWALFQLCFLLCLTNVFFEI